MSESFLDNDNDEPIMQSCDIDREFEIECTNKLIKIFSHEECMSLGITLLGSLDHMVNYLTMELSIDKFLILPTNVRYGILQFMQWHRVVGNIVRDEIKCREEVKLAYFPSIEPSLRKSEEFKKRINILIKALYETMDEKDK